MHRVRVRLLVRQRLENFNCGVGLSGVTMGGSQNKPRVRVSRDGFKDLVRLLYSESGIPFQKSCSVTKCNFERSNRLRNAVQLTIH